MDSRVQKSWYSELQVSVQTNNNASAYFDSANLLVALFYNLTVLRISTNCDDSIPPVGRQTESQLELDALLPSVLDRAFKGEL